MLKRDAYMLSTVHYSLMVLIEKKSSNISKVILKPLCITEYDETRGIVDESSMKIIFSESLRKTIK